MGLSSELILAQVKDHMTLKEVQDTLSSYGVVIEGSDIKTIVESWSESVRNIGAAQRLNVEIKSDSQIIVDIGECVFAQATAHIRMEDPKTIPPCPFVSMLTAAIEVNTGKMTNITECEYKPELNTSIFTVVVE